MTKVDKSLPLGELQERYQRGILRLSFMIAIGVIVFELLLFAMKYELNILVPDVNADVYVRFYLLRPVIAMVVLASFNGAFFSLSKKGTLLHDSIALSFLSEILTVIVAIHYRYPVVYGIMAFPIMMSCVYASERILERVFLVEIIGLILDVAYISYATDFLSRPKYFHLSMALVFIISLISLLYVRHGIQFEKYKLNKITNELEKNRTLETENRELVHDSKIDGLSKLPNYKFLVETAEEWIKKRNGICFVMIDIDDFKKVNDTMGHEFGNVVIFVLSRMLEKKSGDSVFVARYGGEEFGILLSDSNPEEATRIADKLRQEFANRKYRETSKQNTFSGGVAAYEEGMTVTDLFQKADEKLYVAKSNGKNQIVS